VPNAVLGDRAGPRTPTLWAAPQNAGGAPGNEIIGALGVCSLPASHGSEALKTGAAEGSRASPINELWPRLEDHKYRWELHSYGLPEGYHKLDVRSHRFLIEALKGVGAADNKLLQAHTKADHHKPGGPGPPDQAPPHSAVSDFPIG
jgi:hypothetical protein